MERSENTGGGVGVGAGAWGIATASIGLLLLAIVLVGVVGIAQNERVRGITERAFAYDVEVEDEGDDLRAAVLDLRHYHRNIVFEGPSVAARGDLDRAHAALLEEIEELDALNVEALGVTPPAELRRLAEAYAAGFVPALDRYGAGGDGFALASDEGLGRIRELEDAAEEIDEIGEKRAEASMARVHEATATERLVLFALVGGVVLVGIALAAVTGRVLARLRASYDREQEAVRELERTLRTKNDFIADASHELRTPLTVIRGNAEIGLGSPEAAVHRDVLSEISAEATRMSRLVDDLLFLVRSDGGVPTLEREYLPARWLLARIVKPAEVLARQRGSCLSFAPDGGGDLEADAARVEQAVLILVDNAAKHSPPGECVALSARTLGGELAIEVADRGPGIPPEELPLIFDRFYQVGQRRTRKKGGSGLGLAIAKTIVEAHGGRIEVDSRPGRGTRVTLHLPLGAAPAPAPALAATGHALPV